MDLAFPHISAEEWRDKLLKDLRGKSLESLEWEVGTIKASPLNHPDILGDITQALKRSQFTSSKIPAMVIDSTTEAKEQIQLGLSNGIGSFFLAHELKDAESDVLDGVLLDLVDIHWRTQPIRCQLSGLENVVPNIISALDQFLSHQEKTLEVELGNTFYLNVCGLRALRICLEQINRDTNLEVPHILGTYVYNSEKDLAQNLLESMSIFTAGMLGGIDSLTSLNTPDAESMRLMTNGIHLLLLESGIPLDNDLVSGAYYFENLTVRIAEEVWTGLTNAAE